jgi:hypothetical protein
MRNRLLGLVFIAGCTASAASVQRPTIVSIRDEVQICLDGGGLRVGQPVRFLRSVCKPLNAKSSVVHCTPEPIADGEIVRVEGDRCAEVRVRAGTTLETSDGVELAAR